MQIRILFDKMCIDLTFVMQSIATGALPADTVIPKNLYEEKEALHDLDDDDRRQMTKLKTAAVAIEQAQQAKLKKGKSKR